MRQTCTVQIGPDAKIFYNTLKLIHAFLLSLYWAAIIFERCNLPTICTVLDALSCPLTLTALHVYRALSSSSASSITKEPFIWTVYLPLLRSIRPSFVHVIVGRGTPLVGHWMTTFVLVSAVRSSPMVNTMELRFWASIDDGFSGMLIFGLEGSVE